MLVLSSSVTSMTRKAGSCRQTTVPLTSLTADIPWHHAGISCRDGPSAAFFAFAESTGTQTKIQGSPSMRLNRKVLRNKWKSL